MKTLKRKIESYIYKYITKWFIKLTKKLNQYDIPFQENEYEGIYVNEPFKGCKYSLLSPIECIYFAFNEIYHCGLRRFNIQGITMDYDNAEFIKVNIMTARPGCIIGRGGKDINNLTKTLTKYFGKIVEINLIETKTNFTIITKF